MIEFGHGTHAGMRRTRNEDTYYADAALGLFLVADGMGGHRHGEVAAALVRETMVDRVSRGDDLLQAVQAAAARLLDCPREGPDALPMGSTIAALRVRADGYSAVWVGDSRIYLWQDKLRQISHDQALAQELVAAGRMNADAAAGHTPRNVLTQALGVTASEQLRMGMARGALTPHTSFLLCTDGLTEAVDDTAIARVVARIDLPAQECVDQLLLSALDRGGDDNVTALIVRCT